MSRVSKVTDRPDHPCPKGLIALQWWLLSTCPGHMPSLSSPFQFVYWPRRMIPSPLPSTQTPYIWIQRTPTLECWNPTLSKEASSSLCWHPNSHNCKGPPSSWRLSQQSLSECWEEEEHCCSLQESVYTACSSNHQRCCGGHSEQHYIHRWAHWWTINIALLAVNTNQHLYFLTKLSRARGAGRI